MRVLSVSDVVVNFIYSPQVKKNVGDVDLIIDCGDNPYEYLEFLVSTFNVPAYYVRGNHNKKFSPLGNRAEAMGATDLHCRNANQDGLLLAGIEGCLRYSLGPYQYSQESMWMHVFRLIPGLLLNEIRFGRFLDVFVTHAPPTGIHDDVDLPHRGIKAFLWFIKVFKPKYHFHGHIHTYRPGTEMVTVYGQTRVINTYPYRLTDLQL